MVSQINLVSPIKIITFNMSQLKSLVYVDISTTNSYESCPISTRETPCVVCKEKCSLTFTNEYFQASCSLIQGGLSYNGINSSATPYLTFNEVVYKVESAYLLTPSINTYKKTEKYCDFVIILSSQSGKLIIYIPILVTTSTTITIPDDLNKNQPLSSIQLFTFLPSQRPFYYYNAPYNGSSARYIIFPTTSCINIGTISFDDYNTICGTDCSAENPIKNPSNNYFTLYKNKVLTSPIYYNKEGANAIKNDDYQFDCYFDDENEEETGEEIELNASKNQKIFNILLYCIAGLCVIVIAVFAKNYVNNVKLD